MDVTAKVALDRLNLANWTEFIGLYREPLDDSEPALSKLCEILSTHSVELELGRLCGDDSDDVYRADMHDMCLYLMEGMNMQGTQGTRAFLDVCEIDIEVSLALKKFAGSEREIKELDRKVDGLKQALGRYKLAIYGWSRSDDLYEGGKGEGEDDD
ncbi:hypothetical protein BDQ17DRAFT_1429567 [Cyathus striatus]|nr:hypothetical protein BDQ17DRAFT_1429567 [Cyathus striatus]